MIWQKKDGPPPDTKGIGYTHESVLGDRKAINSSDSFCLQLRPKLGDTKIQIMIKEGHGKPWITHVDIPIRKDQIFIIQ